MVGEDPLQFKWLRQDEAFHTYVGRTRLLSSRSFYVASKVKVFFFAGFISDIKSRDVLVICIVGGFC